MILGKKTRVQLSDKREDPNHRIERKSQRECTSWELNLGLYCRALNQNLVGWIHSSVWLKRLGLPEKNMDFSRMVDHLRGCKSTVKPCNNVLEKGK
ncbi:uncharacterized protein LOC107842894 [Capsicum annuum]|uniref:uncharacterized protein LOC107842894 n=1 Tax=Capsicum annuum TaxID=4072 RepID=UPI0007BF3FAB|nr:uncharacterized protein LOC107842894 [Capsicum annuum]